MTKLMVDRDVEDWMDENYLLGGANQQHNYAMEAQAVQMSDRREPMQKRLLRQKVEHQKEIGKIDEMLQLLSRNPDIERILDLLGR